MNDWDSFICNEKTKEYFKQLELNGSDILPPIEKRFRAFDLCTFDNVKVIIIGQDPYHGKNQANGLAFSIEPGQKTPPSLRNIFKELKEDTGTIRTNTDLSDWAEQGVLLLNTVLTVKENKPNSHKGMGWEIFTNKVIKKLNDEKQNLVFILWGTHAQKISKHIDNTKHFVLKSNHSSPLSANRGGFFGRKPFSKCNEYLHIYNKELIKW